MVTASALRYCTASRCPAPRNVIADVLPVKPFNDALSAAFTTADAGPPWRDCLVLSL
ncbi:hypothetical protein [Streptomyces sp. TRM70350]|uniref:hypothetical protein n=1 Tax=Streptomyces sp. TRM70350 TaxID=2856165 RepID=UPI001C492650|nr:hypothetical protein [Streptomyces sp. TRM70350]MBV7699725.1 hypothetical protein [Streptomyces sp. TRM70350]